MHNNIPQFIFFGTPDVARKTLELLKQHGILPRAIVTSPDKPSGRGLHLTETEVSVWAQENNIECLKPEKITSDFIEILKKSNPELFVVVAYGKILPQALISLPKFGTVNIHYSLLPKYRGASPVEQALLQGETQTGVTIQEMQLALDSGPILAKQEEEIAITDTKESLRDRLITIGATLLIDLLPKIKTQSLEKEIQDESKATHCSKIKKENGEIDPNGPALENWNKYRAFEGWPGVYFFISKDGKKIRIKITHARYQDGMFIIERVIPEGKKELSYLQFTQSHTLK
jgi:methionyl-tRNA formyltransferase